MKYVDIRSADRILTIKPHIKADSVSARNSQDLIKSSTNLGPSVFVQVKNTSELHHRAKPQCVPLPAECLRQARQGESNSPDLGGGDH